MTKLIDLSQAINRPLNSIRTMLKLNGKLLSFSIDAGFSGVVDSLFVVGLRNTNTKLLRRFVKNNQFNSNHRLPDATKKENHVHS